MTLLHRTPQLFLHPSLYPRNWGRWQRESAYISSQSSIVKMHLVWVDSGQLKYMLWKCWDIHMHQLCPQRGEWSCPDILKPPSGKKRKENYQFVIKAQGSLSMYRWWLHLRMSWSAGYLPLENGAAIRVQASGWRSCGCSLNPQGFWPYTRLSPASGWLSGEGRSPSSPNSHQMVFVIQRQHFFNLYNDF